MVSIDRVIEFNDTAGNGKFDQSADAVLSYYGAKLYNQSSLLTAKQRAAHAASDGDVGDILWHGGFAWDHVQSSVQYASPSSAADPTAEPQLNVVMVNITTLPPHVQDSHAVPAGKVGLLSVEIIQEAQADDKEVEVRALHWQLVRFPLSVGVKSQNRKAGGAALCCGCFFFLTQVSTACPPDTDSAHTTNSAQDQSVHQQLSVHIELAVIRSSRRLPQATHRRWRWRWSWSSTCPISVAFTSAVPATPKLV